MKLNENLKIKIILYSFKYVFIIYNILIVFSTFQQNNFGVSCYFAIRMAGLGDGRDTTNGRTILGVVGYLYPKYGRYNAYKRLLIATELD